MYVNRLWVGTHEGGYDGFTLDITEALDALADGADAHELLLTVFDPSNRGPQPFGKQRIEAMYAPGGDTYSPVSGVWQPVWLESLPSRHIRSLSLRPNTERLELTVLTSVPDAGAVRVDVLDGATVVATAEGKANLPFSVRVPQPRLWSPESPFLYNLSVSYPDDGGAGDSVTSYFGMRQITLCSVGGVMRPCLNGEWRFLAGVLDQSWWPDGQFTAPGEAALVSDVAVLKDFGMNFIRLHQKTNPCATPLLFYPRRRGHLRRAALGRVCGQGAVVLRCRPSRRDGGSGCCSALRISVDTRAHQREPLDRRACLLLA